MFISRSPSRARLSVSIAPERAVLAAPIPAAASSSIAACGRSLPRRCAPPRASCAVVAVGGIRGAETPRPRPPRPSRKPPRPPPRAAPLCASCAVVAVGGTEGAAATATTAAYADMRPRRPTPLATPLRASCAVVAVGGTGGAETPRPRPPRPSRKPPRSPPRLPRPSPPCPPPLSCFLATMGGRPPVEFPPADARPRCILLGNRLETLTERQPYRRVPRLRFPA